MCAPCLSLRTLFCTVSASVPNDTIKEPGWFHIYMFPRMTRLKKKNLSFVKKRGYSIKLLCGYKDFFFPKV